MASNIGLSREYPGEYFPPDTLLYQLALRDSGEAADDVTLGHIPPLFGTVPAERAIHEFMDKEMGIDSKDVSGDD